MIGRIERLLADSWQTLGMERPPRRGYPRLLVLNGGVSVRSKIVCPVWMADNPLPSVVAKFPRNPAYNSRLLAEYAALQELGRYLEGPLRVPWPILHADLQGYVVTVESAVQGRPLLAYLREHPLPRSLSSPPLAALIDWVARLHMRSARPASPIEAEQLVFRPFDAASSLYLSDEETAALETLRTEAGRLLQARPLVTVFNHNDLGPPNVLVDEAGRFSGLIDWEAASRGLPALDLFYFIAQYASTAYSRQQDDEPFRACYFAAGTEPAETSRKWLSEYCALVGAHLDWLPVLFALCWINHSLNEQEQRAAAEREELSSRSLHSVSGQQTEETNHFRGFLRYYLQNMRDFIFPPGSGSGS